MNTTNTQNKTAQNYQLITINRYDIADSEVHVVTEDFMKKFKKMMKNETEGQIASLRGGYKGLDSEEQSWLWVKTDKKVDAESQEFIDQYIEDFEEFSSEAEDCE